MSREAEWADAYAELAGDYCCVRAALQWLVELKDGPRDANYEQHKPLAWESARDALAATTGKSRDRP